MKFGFSFSLNIFDRFSLGLFKNDGLNFFLI